MPVVGKALGVALTLRIVRRQLGAVAPREPGELVRQTLADVDRLVEERDACDERRVFDPATGTSVRRVAERRGIVGAEMPVRQSSTGRSADERAHARFAIR